MDRHQPAFWLSQDPVKAAEFLARTAVASRVVGGFVKTAQNPPAAGGSWMTPGVSGMPYAPDQSKPHRTGITLRICPCVYRSTQRARYRILGREKRSE